MEGTICERLDENRRCIDLRFHLDFVKKGAPSFQGRMIIYMKQ
jgi:hypothetical protein